MPQHTVDFTPPESPFLSFLDWMDRPGQSVLNLIKGNRGAAGRQALDFLGEIPDALLPGDLIPNATHRGDATTTSEALGLDDDASPWVRGATDFVGGIVSNPLSFVGGAPAKLVGSGAKAGLGLLREAAPEAMGALEHTGKGALLKAKRILGYRKLRPEDETFLQGARAHRKGVESAYAAHYGKVFDGFDEAHQNALGDAFDNLRWKDGKATGLLDEGTSLAGGTPSTIDDQIARIQRRIDAIGDPSLDTARLKKAVAEMVGTNQRMWDEGVKGGVFKHVDESPYGVGDYLQRHFNFDLDNANIDEMAAGMPSSAAKRSLGTDRDLLAYLQDPENAKVKFERNAVKRSLTRGENQGRLLERAQVGKRVSSSPDFYLAGKQYRDLAVSKIDDMKRSDPELGLAMEDVFKGLPPRQGVLKVLAKANSYWKPYVVYGIFAPKIGSIVRNVVGGGFQIAATPDAAKDLPGFLSRVGDVFGGAVDDGIERVMGTRLGGGSELTKAIKKVDNALATSGGQLESAIGQLDDPVLQAAVRHGVLDGFVSGEQVGQNLLKSGILGKSKVMRDWAEMPGDIFKGVEQRMRLGTFMSLVKEHGYTAERAAQAVRDSYYDYNVWNQSNRTLRDIIPFAAFQTNAAKQSAQWIARNPAVGVAAAQLFHGPDPDHPVPQWVSEQASVPLGNDEKGNPQYATGFGLPIESLNGIPGLSGRDFERAVVAKTSPLLKGVYSWASGHDPHFGTPYGSYDKAPRALQALGAPEHGALGRTYREITDWGFNPLDPVISQVSKAMNPDASPAAKGLDLFTGANVVSVDEQQALQQLLQQTLEANPQVRKHLSLYQVNGDDDTQSILAEYNRVSHDVHARKKAQHQAAGVD